MNETFTLALFLVGMFLVFGTGIHMAFKNLAQHHRRLECLERIIELLKQNEANMRPVLDGSAITDQERITVPTAGTYRVQGGVATKISETMIEWDTAFPVDPDQPPMADEEA